MRLRLPIAAAVTAGLLLAACGGDDDDTTSETTAAETTETTTAETTAPAGPQDIVATAAAAGQFTTLTAAIEAAGLTETLQGDGPFTVFAPTDAAFEALPDGALDALLADPDALADVLTYHVVSGQVMAADVVPGPVPSLEGGSLMLSTTGGGVQVNGVEVEQADVEASNGVIHVIGEVLLPAGLDIGGEAATVVDAIRGESDLAQLGIALQSAGLVETLQGPGPFTVFAPTNEAFLALGTDALNALNADPAQLTSVLTYHVLPAEVLAADVTPGDATTVNGAPLTITVEGTTVKVNDATVVRTDIVTGNGVIHVIDAVLLPPQS